MFTVTVASCLHCEDSAGHKHNNLVVSFHIKVLLILQTAAADDDVHRPAALWLADDSTLLEKKILKSRWTQRKPDEKMVLINIRAGEAVKANEQQETKLLDVWKI